MTEIPIKRRRPPVEDEPDYSRAFYPDPPSHDFLVWLVIAELMRRHHGAPSPLRVKFGLMNGQLGIFDYGHRSPWHEAPYGCGVNRPYSDMMMANVLRPAIEMIGAVEEPSINAPWNPKDIPHWVEYDYHVSFLVDAVRAGFKLPKFSPPQWAHDEVRKFLGDKKPVIITLRESGIQPERNSRLSAWLKFARSILHDHDVLFLRDTCRADEAFFGYPVWERASRNAYVRAALYQHALVNMFTSNGPQGWCMFTDAPYLTFKQLMPSLPGWDHGNAKGWTEQAHLDIGQQWPWALPTQRMTWTDDTFENIRDAFERFMAGPVKSAIGIDGCRDPNADTSNLYACIWKEMERA